MPEIFKGNDEIFDKARKLQENRGKLIGKGKADIADALEAKVNKGKNYRRDVEQALEESEKALK